MVDFRRSILRQLRRTHRTRYWLAERAADVVSRDTTYAYLRGEREIRSDLLAHLLSVAELKIVPSKT